MRQSLVVLVLCTTLGLAQKTPPTAPAKLTPPEPFSVRVYGGPWEPGELRTCSTYWHHSDFMLCDEDTRDRISIPPALHPDGTVMSKNERETYPEHVFTSIQVVPPSKKFLVQFSKLPWRLASPNPDKNSDIPLATYPVPYAETQTPTFADPDPGSSNMESRWDCTKEKTITCKFLRSF